MYKIADILELVIPLKVLTPPAAPSRPNWVQNAKIYETRNNGKLHAMPVDLINEHIFM